MVTGRKYFGTLLLHWKKSVLFTVLGGYGIKCVKEWNEDNTLRRNCCCKAKKYGDLPITLDNRPRRITVFLNPAARSGKACKLFEKTAGPILYLAGIEVNVIRTEYQGHVKKYLNDLPDNGTDAIVVAGGDGTLLEAITGILRRENKKFHSIPVGVIPLGRTNTFAGSIFGLDRDDVSMITDAALAIVQNNVKPVDVLKIDGGAGKTTFALCGMELGAYRDAEECKSKYWYLGPLKSYWTYVRTALQAWPPSIDAKLRYVDATAENMHVEISAVRDVSWNFWHFLTRYRNRYLEVNKETQKDPDDHVIVKDLSTVDLTITSPNMLPTQEFPGIEVAIGPSEPSRAEVISQGWSGADWRKRRRGLDKNRTLLVKRIEIDTSARDNKTCSWFNIDGERFEAIPVTVSLMQKKLNIFTPAVDRTGLQQS